MALVGGWVLSRALGVDARLRRTFGSRGSTSGGSVERAGEVKAVEVSRSITIGEPADDLYEAWRDPETFSRVMGHFAEVTSPDGDRFYWTVHGPLGQEVSWESRLVEEEPGEFLRWETPPDATLPNEGSVRFRPAPGDRGTVATLSLVFDPPGGTLGDTVLEQLDVVPETLAGTALGRFKSLVETGGIQTLEGNPSARGRGGLW